jgi:effector-binding domain-containing protein
MKAGSSTEHRTIVDPVPREPEAFLFRPSPARTPHRQRHVIGYYEDSPYGGEILVHATLPLNADTSEDYDFAFMDLPKIDQAAMIVHRGFMDNVMPTIQTLGRWIDEIGCRSAGYNREVFPEYHQSRDARVTELLEPITTS